LIYYHFTDTEIKKLLETMVIIYDTREQQNSHILKYLEKRQIPIKKQKLDVGDYSCMIPANPELGIYRDVYLNSVVERKANIDEICGNLQKSTQAAFENELIRSQRYRFVLFVEQEDFDEKLIHGNYRSAYEPKALKARLESFKAKYNFEIIPMSKLMIGHNIYHRFYYQMKNYLKRGAF